MQALVFPWLCSAAVHGSVAAFVYGLGSTRLQRPAVPISVEFRKPPPQAAVRVEKTADQPAPRPAQPAMNPPPNRPPIRHSPPQTVAPQRLPALPPTSTSMPAPTSIEVATPTVPPAPPPPAPSASSAAKPGVTAGKGTDLSGYLGRVNQAVAAKRRYPELAMQLQQEGDVIVSVHINRDGTLARQPAIFRSCGHELLDAEALRMVVRAAPLPNLPTDYPAAIAEVRIPVRFHLED